MANVEHPRTFTRVAVLGLGLVGGSVALRLAAAPDLQVAGADPDPDTRAAAAAQGITTYDAPGAWLGDCDLVILACPLDVMEAVLTSALPRLSPDAVVIDVGSVKEPVHAMVERAGAGDRFVGCHPMAGTEKAGFQHAFADLVVQVTWAVTIADDLPEPEAEAAAARAVRVVRFLVERFEAGVCLLPPQVHDSSVAVISHVPHALANLLLENAQTTDHREVAAHLVAGSFRDGTRVAGTNPERTQNMLTANRVRVAEELRRIRSRLDTLVHALEDDQSEVVRAFLDRVRAEAEVIRDPDRRVVTLDEVDVGLVRSLLAAPDRAHLVTG